jgi:saccharopine dehydrogenase-like NADP-dependent oxidoreductase
MKHVAVIGHGLIGSAIVKYLRKEIPSLVNVTAFDIREQEGVYPMAPTGEFGRIAAHFDAIVVATPYTVNKEIIAACAEHGTAYFDMTEDVFVTAAAKQAASESIGWFMPQCGLAPGVVSILAKRMVDKLGADVTNRRVEIRVGALPRAANNHIKYYLTWSSEGLVNEYNNPCHAIVDSKPVDLVPLEGVEQLSIDGTQYEAFNTSGGLGTLRESLGGIVENMNYKTMRYPGHRDYFHFLLHDLGLSKRMPVLVDILNQAVPHVTDDVIVISINACATEPSRGWVNGEQYTTKIYGQDGMNAIQLTTAAGLCSAVHWWSIHDRDEAIGFKRSEDIPWDFFKQSPFSKPYLA